MKHSVYYHLSLFFSLIFYVNSVLANDGPSPQIWLEQIGSNVKVTYQLHEDGEPGIDYPLTLIRDDSSSNSIVLVEDTSQIGINKAVESGVMCRVDDSIEEPIADCDHDNVIECAGSCSQWYKFDYLDKSVPLGTYTYYLKVGSHKYAETEITVTELDSGLEDTVVEDTDLEDTDLVDAADSDSDSDSDADSDADADADSDTDADNGCSISLSPDNIAIGSVMLVIGIISLLISSRRKR